METQTQVRHEVIKGVYSPHVWKSSHLNNTFKRFSQKPPASSPRQASDQFDSAFANAILDKTTQGEVFKSIPLFQNGVEVAAIRMTVCATHGEAFIYGNNGALEVRKLGRMFENIIDLAFHATKKTFLLQRLYYAKAGADGRDVWGNDMHDPGYVEAVTKNLCSA